MTQPVGELTEQAAQPLFDAWLEQRDGRLAWFRERSGCPLELSRAGLCEGWGWYAAWWQRTLGTENLEQDLPYWWTPPAPDSGTTSFPDAAVVVIDALAILLGEALIAADPQFSWTMHRSPKQVVGSNEPSLVRGDPTQVPVKPLNPLKNMTFRLMRGDERGIDPARIGALFDANLNPPSLDA